MSQLPDTLYVQTGQLGGQNLFVNRTAAGALGQNLGAGFIAGMTVGVYKLQRVGKIDLAIVETPPTAPAAVLPASTNT